MLRLTNYVCRYNVSSFFKTRAYYHMGNATKTPQLCARWCLSKRSLSNKQSETDQAEQLKRIKQLKSQTQLAKLLQQSMNEERAIGEQQPPDRKGDKQKLITFVVLCSIGGAITLYLKGFSTSDDEKKAPSSQVVINKNPATSDQIPHDVPYLLIGGGTASFSAFRAIKSADPLAKILIISDEEYLPYMRPPLSKEMWFNTDKSISKQLRFQQWNGKERSLLYEPEEFYTHPSDLLDASNGGVAVARGWKIIDLNVVNRTATLDDNTVIKFGKCLLATGASPRSCALFEGDAQIESKTTLLRSIQDYENLHDVIDSAKSIAIIGNGFIGSELACAFARYENNKVQIHQIFPEGGNMANILPEYLSRWTMEKIRKEGVNIVPNVSVQKVQNTSDGLKLTLSNGTEMDVSHVVLATGVDANTQLAERAGLEVDPVRGGYVVNPNLQATANIYAAGDCASFYDIQLGRRRVLHHDHAVVSGRLAGENMASTTSGDKRYTHQAMFWSDLGPDIGYEAIGIVDSKLPTVGVFMKPGENNVSDKSEQTEQSQAKDKVDKSKGDSKESVNEDYSKGIVFYLREKKIVGLVMWNVFNRMSIARQILKSDQIYEDLNDVAKLFRLHEE